MKKYPDHIVWDEVTQKFHANILPYASNVAGPKIEIEDVSLFKQRGVNKIETIFNTEYNELVTRYNKLVNQMNLNQVIYNSSYNFEPIVGETYHLYRKQDNKTFLSIISPTEWNQEHIVSVMLCSNLKWERVDI